MNPGNRGGGLELDRPTTSILLASSQSADTVH